MAEKNRLSETARVTEDLLRSGQISRRAAQKIYEALGVTPTTPQTEDNHEQRSDFLSWVSAGVSAGLTALGASLSGVFVSAPTEKKPQRRLMNQEIREGVTRPPTGEIDSLLSFETLAATLKPLFNEYVWWFIAMVLVISGSVMGIREAWLRFEGILRPLTILFAFFTYHALFLGLGIFLFRRSAATGRMLLILSATLIPVMFSIANSVTRQAAEAGAVATAISLVLSLVTLYPIAGRVGIPYFSAVFYLPIPFALTALSGLAPAMPFLAFVLIPALAGSVLAATGIQENARPAQKFIFAIAGIVVLLFTLAAFDFAPENDLARALRTLAILAVLAQFTFLLRALDFTSSKVFVAIEIALFAVLAVMPVMAAGTLAGGARTLVPFSYTMLVYPFAVAVFLRAAMLHNAAMHPLIFMVMLFSYHVSRLLTSEPAWQIFAFFIFPLVLPWFGAAFDERKKRLYLYWGVAAGLLGSILQAAYSGPHIAAATTGLLTAITIHRSAGLARSAFHYLSPVGLMVFIGKLPLLAGVTLQPFEIFSILALLYGIGGLIFERRAAPAGEHGGYPIEDLSLICAMGALLALNAFQPTGDEFTLNLIPGRLLPLRPLLWFGAVYTFLNLRTLRDRSMLVSLIAHLGAMLYLYTWLKPRDFAEGGFLLLWLAAAFYAVAFFFRREAVVSQEKFGRIFLLKLRLPFNAGGINNIGRASGLATLLALALLLICGANWISNPDFGQRHLMLVDQIGLMVLLFAVFHFQTFTYVRARGSLVLLFALLSAIAFTAVINRLGRPLPIDAVGLRLLLLFPVLALITAVFKIYGPRYGKYLGAETQGAWYFSVPVTGVCGLIFLLAYDTLAVSAFDFNRSFYFVPPTLYLALALYPLILAHTVSTHLRHLFYFFVPVFLAAVFAERSFLGPALSNQNTLSAWLPVNFAANPMEVLVNFNLALADGYSYLTFRQNIVLGIAAGVLLLSILAFVSRRQVAGFMTHTLFSRNSSGVSGESGIWSLIFTLVIALLSFQVAAIPPGVILLVVVFFYLVAGNIRASAFILFIAGLLLVHGGAHVGVLWPMPLSVAAGATLIYPVWPGPILVIAAILMVWPARKIAQKLDLAENFVAETGFLAGILYIIAAFFYTATEGRPANPLQAGISVLSANVNYLMTGGFYRSYALPITLLLTSAFFKIALARIEGRARVALVLLGHFSFVAALTATVWLALSLRGHIFDFMTAAPFMISAILVFEVFVTTRLRALREKDADIHAGTFTARDTMILFCGLLFIPLSQNLSNPLPYAGLALLAGLVLYLFINIQAAFTSKKTRYVYIAQATIAGIYYAARPILRIDSPQVDAFFAFGYAFALLGISVAAERMGVTVVSEPTRRFAALMPVAVGFLVDNFRSFDAALYSVISSGLYFALSRLGERNLFAALAAIALNAALFFVALAKGFDSSEFYAFPIGLTIVFFATIFKDSLSPENQARVRTIGGLVAYIPAAMHVTLRSGLAQNPLYSVIFGGVCLAGILAGTIFHVRSYLFLGVLFFTLNIVANLVQEGLQNQFVGFVLLTVTGLLLIAILIVYNLKKEAIHAGFLRLKQRFAGWS